MMGSDNNIIEFQINDIYHKQIENEKKLDQLADNFYTTGNDLKSKTKVFEIQLSQKTEEFKSLQKNIENLVKVSNNHDESITKIEKWAIEHENRDIRLQQKIEDFTDKLDAYTITINKNIENKEKEMKPIIEDFVIRQANKKWKDKLLWFFLSAIMAGTVIPPIVNLFS